MFADRTYATGFDGCAFLYSPAALITSHIEGLEHVVKANARGRTMHVRRLLVAVSLLVVGLVIALAVSNNRAQAQSDVILTGCKIPKSFGKLVTITNPPNSQLAGQAVFEDGDGTVRWVALMFRAQMPTMPKPQSTTQGAAYTFPQLPTYECELGHVWYRH